MFNRQIWKWCWFFFHVTFPKCQTIPLRPSRHPDCNIHSVRHFVKISRLFWDYWHECHCCWPFDPHRAVWTQSISGTTRQKRKETFSCSSARESGPPCNEFQCCHWPNCMNGDIISYSLQPTACWTVLATQRECWSSEYVFEAPWVLLGFGALADPARCSVWSVIGDRAGAQWVKMKLISV